MTTSKSAGKLRPYRIDWFDINEALGNKAPVRSNIVRAVTAEEAKRLFLGFPGGEERLIVVRAYRFYKKLPKGSQKYVAVEKLFSDAKAAEVIKQVEAYHADDVAELNAVTDNLAEKMRAATQATSGPDSPATKAVVKDLNDMMSHDKHEQMMDKFKPDETLTPKMAAIITPDSPAPVAYDRDKTKALQEALSLEPGNNKFTPWPTAPVSETPKDDRTLNMMEFGAPAPAVCPECGIRIDSDGDGNCPVCTPPAYKQQQTPSPDISPNVPFGGTNWRYVLLVLLILFGIAGILNYFHH